MLAGALPPERIMGVEASDYPRTDIREGTSINLAAIRQMHDYFPALDLVVIESGGVNLARPLARNWQTSPSRYRRLGWRENPCGKRGTRSDPLVINKADLVPRAGASPEVMDKDAKRMHGERPFVFTNLKTDDGLNGERLRGKYWGLGVKQENR